MSKKHPGKAVVPRILVPDDVCGPAMLALSPPMRAFAYEWVFGGTKSQKDAAIAAGYSNVGDAAKSQGSELMRRPDVQRAIEELSRGLMRTEGPASIHEIIRLRDHGLDERVRLKAAQDLLDRAGLSAVQQSHVTVEHVDDRETKEIVAAAIEYARNLGDPRLAYKLLGDSVPKDVIDAEFVEVAKEPPAPASAVSPEEAAHRAHENALRRERQSLTPEELSERKNLDRSRRRDEAKARYTKARKDIAAKAARGEQLDIVDAIKNAEAAFVAAYTEAQSDGTDDADGRAGLEDLFGSSSDAAADAGELVDTRTNLPDQPGE